MFKEFTLNNQTYRVSKVLIWVFVSISILLSIYAMSLNGFSGKEYIYSFCPSNPSNDSFMSRCFNIYYNSSFCGNVIDVNDPLCTTEFISSGQSLGVDAPWIVKNLFNIIGGLGLFIIILNHFNYNMNFNFGGD